MSLSPQKASFPVWLPAVAVVLLAWLLFLRHLDLESMWYDESISWSHAAEPSLFDLMNRWPLGTGHPPLYFMWAWAWVQWTGSQALFVMRLTAVIPMLLSVALVYRVGYEWFKSRWVALGAMVFMATSGLIIYYAREMRMYALMILLALASWQLLRRVLENGRWRTLAAYGAAVALMGYTHYLSALIVAAQAFAALALYPRRFPRLLAAYALAVLAFLPWLPVFVVQQQTASLRAGREGGIGQFDGNEPTTLATIAQFVTRYSAGQTALVVALLALALALGLSAANARPYRRRLWMTVCWFALPIVVLFAVNLVVPLYNPRYLLAVIPALALLVGVAVEQLPARARLPLALVIGVSGVLFHTTAFRPPKIPHRELLTTIYERFLPGDRIWYNLSYGALGSSIEEEVRYYLQQVVPEFGGEDFIWNAPEDFADPDINRVWDVRPYWIPMPPEAAEALSATRAESEEYEFGEYAVRLYEAPPRDQPPAQFGDLFALLVGEMKTAYRPGDTVSLKLWWRALEPAPLDYSYGLYLRDSGGSLRAQSDAGLVAGEDVPTSRWQPSETYALATPALALPASLPPGSYRLWLSVYYWETPQPLPVDGAQDRLDGGASAYRIAEITIE